MNTHSPSWTRSERTLVLGVAVAPALVVLGSALVFSVLSREVMTLLDMMFLAMLVLPLAYGTLFFVVLPALMILKRKKNEALLPFVAAVGLSSLAPWALLYCVYLLVVPAADHPPQSFVAAILLVPASLATVVAAGIWCVSLRGKNAA